MRIKKKNNERDRIGKKDKQLLKRTGSIITTLTIVTLSMILLITIITIMTPTITKAIGTGVSPAKIIFNINNNPEKRGNAQEQTIRITTASPIINKSLRITGPHPEWFSTRILDEKFFYDKRTESSYYSYDLLLMIRVPKEAPKGVIKHQLTISGSATAPAIPIPISSADGNEEQNNIINKTSDEEEKVKGKNTIEYTLSVPIIVNITSEEITKCVAGGLTIPLTEENSIINIKLLVENKGNIAIIPGATIMILSSEGEPLFFKQIKNLDKEVMPRTTGEEIISINPQLKPGTYRLELRITPCENELRGKIRIVDKGMLKTSYELISSYEKNNNEEEFIDNDNKKTAEYNQYLNNQNALTNKNLKNSQYQNRIINNQEPILLIDDQHKILFYDEENQLTTKTVKSMKENNNKTRKIIADDYYSLSARIKNTGSSAIITKIKGTIIKEKKDFQQENTITKVIDSDEILIMPGEEKEINSYFKISEKGTYLLKADLIINGQIVKELNKRIIVTKEEPAKKNDLVIAEASIIIAIIIISSLISKKIRTNKRKRKKKRK